ncbi:MAG: hypothetical protein U0Z44_07745 [Kouleothrix sp.]
MRDSTRAAITIWSPVVLSWPLTVMVVVMPTANCSWVQRSCCLLFAIGSPVRRSNDMRGAQLQKASRQADRHDDTTRRIGAGVPHQMAKVSTSPGRTSV